MQILSPSPHLRSSHSNLPAREMETSLNFSGALPPQRPSEGNHSVPPQKKGFFRRLFSGKTLLWAAPLSNLIGGPLLIASALLPGKTKADLEKEALKAPPPAIVAKADPVSAEPAKLPGIPGEFTQLTPAEIKATEEGVNQLKETLKSLGWTMCSLGFLGGAISGLAMGYVSRQPGMFMSSMSNILLVPALLASPDSFTTKAAVALTTAPWLTGFANIYRNQYRLKPGEKPREFDMAPLFSNKAMRQMLAPNGEEVSRGRIAAQRAKYAAQMMGFVGKDQLLVLSDMGQAAKSGLKGGVQFVKQPKTSIKEGAHSVRDAWRFMRGRTTEVPELLKPSVAQAQCAAFLLYAGSLPILFLSGSVNSVNTLGRSLFTAGSGLANFPMWAVGFNKRDNNLILGIPLMIGGTFKMDTDGGMGVMRLGEAGFMNYLRKEVEKSHQEAAPQPASEPQAPKAAETETPPEDLEATAASLSDAIQQEAEKQKAANQ